MKPLIVIAATAALSLAACDSREDVAAEPGDGVKVSITAAGDKPETTPAAAGGAGTRMSLSLPGGINMKVDAPGDMADGSKFDIDGVGLYPGAKISAIDVDAHTGNTPSVVTIGFAAPGDAAAVADWYQKAFEAKGVKARRSGDGFAGTSDDGDEFTLAMTAVGIGKSRGQLTITDKDKGG